MFNNTKYIINQGIDLLKNNQKKTDEGFNTLTASSQLVNNDDPTPDNSNYLEKKDTYERINNTVKQSDTALNKKVFEYKEKINEEGNINYNVFANKSPISGVVDKNKCMKNTVADNHGFSENGIYKKHYLDNTYSLNSSKDALNACNLIAYDSQHTMFALSKENNKYTCYTSSNEQKTILNEDTYIKENTTAYNVLDSQNKYTNDQYKDSLNNKSYSTSNDNDNINSGLLKNGNIAIFDKGDEELDINGEWNIQNMQHITKLVPFNRYNRGPWGWSDKRTGRRAWNGMWDHFSDDIAFWINARGSYYKMFGWHDPRWFYKVYYNDTNQDINAGLLFTFDDYGWIWHNGVKLYQNWRGPRHWNDLSVKLTPGKNVFCIRLVDTGGPDGFAGYIFDRTTKKVLIRTDGTWGTSYKKHPIHNWWKVITDLSPENIENEKNYQKNLKNTTLLLKNTGISDINEYKSCDKWDGGKIIVDSIEATWGKNCWNTNTGNFSEDFINTSTTIVSQTQSMINICIGTDGLIYKLHESKTSGNWRKIDNINFKNKILSICVLKDNSVILVSSFNNYLYKSENTTLKLFDNSIKLKFITQFNDGSLVGINMDNIIVQKTQDNKWIYSNNLNRKNWQFSSIIQLKDGTIVSIGKINKQIRYLRNNDWVHIEIEGDIKTNGFKDIFQQKDGSLIAVKTDNKMYKAIKSKTSSSKPPPPTKPGCHMHTNDTCPRQPYNNNREWSKWYQDKWGERYRSADITEKSCKQRVSDFNSWCGSTDFSYKWNPPENLIEPTKPGCYVHTKLNCPRQSSFNPPGNKWYRDGWGEKHRGSGNSENNCKRRVREYNNWCGSNDFSYKWNPKTSTITPTNTSEVEMPKINITDNINWIIYRSNYTPSIHRVYEINTSILS